MKQQTTLPMLPSPNISPMPSPNISPMPFRINFVSPFDDNTFHPMPGSPFRPRILAMESREDEHSHQNSINLDPFHFEMDTTSMQELEDALPAKLPVSPLEMKQTSLPTVPSPSIFPMPFRSNFVSPFDDIAFHPMPDSPFHPRSFAAGSRDDEHSHQHFFNLDPFHFEIDTTCMQELEDACWNDPLFGGFLLE
jgi:hypothetical protein